VNENVGAPESGPVMTYQGQPYSMEHAAARLAELDADKDFVAAALNGDIAKQQERAAFRQMSKGATARRDSSCAARCRRRCTAAGRAR